MDSDLDSPKIHDELHIVAASPSVLTAAASETGVVIDRVTCEASAPPPTNEHDYVCQLQTHSQPHTEHLVLCTSPALKHTVIDSTKLRKVNEHNIYVDDESSETKLEAIRMKHDPLDIDNEDSTSTEAWVSASTSTTGCVNGTTATDTQPSRLQTPPMMNGGIQHTPNRRHLINTNNGNQPPTPGELLCQIVQWYKKGEGALVTPDDPRIEITLRNVKEFFCPSVATLTENGIEKHSQSNGNGVWMMLDANSAGPSNPREEIEDRKPIVVETLTNQNHATNTAAANQRLSSRQSNQSLSHGRLLSRSSSRQSIDSNVVCASPIMQGTSLLANRSITPTNFAAHFSRRSQGLVRHATETKLINEDSQPQPQPSACSVKDLMAADKKKARMIKQRLETRKKRRQTRAACVQSMDLPTLTCDERELTKPLQDTYECLLDDHEDVVLIFDLLILCLNFFYQKQTWSGNVQKSIRECVVANLIKSAHQIAEKYQKNGNDQDWKRKSREHELQVLLHLYTVHNDELIDQNELFLESTDLHVTMLAMATNAQHRNAFMDNTVVDIFIDNIPQHVYALYEIIDRDDEWVPPEFESIRDRRDALREPCSSGGAFNSPMVVRKLSTASSSASSVLTSKVDVKRSLSGLRDGRSPSSSSVSMFSDLITARRSSRRSPSIPGSFTSGMSQELGAGTPVCDDSKRKGKRRTQAEMHQEQTQEIEWVKQKRTKRSFVPDTPEAERVNNEQQRRKRARLTSVGEEKSDEETDKLPQQNKMKPKNGLLAQIKQEVKQEDDDDDEVVQESPVKRLRKDVHARHSPRAHASRRAHTAKLLRQCRQKNISKKRILKSLSIKNELDDALDESMLTSPTSTARGAQLLRELMSSGASSPDNTSVSKVSPTARQTCSTSVKKTPQKLRRRDKIKQEVEVKLHSKSTAANQCKAIASNGSKTNIDNRLSNTNKEAVNETECDTSMCRDVRVLVGSIDDPSSSNYRPSCWVDLPTFAIDNYKQQVKSMRLITRKEQKLAAQANESATDGSQTLIEPQEVFYGRAAKRMNIFTGAAGEHEEGAKQEKRVSPKGSSLAQTRIKNSERRVTRQFTDQQSPSTSNENSRSLLGIKAAVAKNRTGRKVTPGSLNHIAHYLLNTTNNEPCEPVIPRRVVAKMTGVTPSPRKRSCLRLPSRAKRLKLKAQARKNELETGTSHSGSLTSSCSTSVLNSAMTTPTKATTSFANLTIATASQLLIPNNINANHAQLNPNALVHTSWKEPVSMGSALIGDRLDAKQLVQCLLLSPRGVAARRPPAECMQLGGSQSNSSTTQSGQSTPSAMLRKVNVKEQQQLGQGLVNCLNSNDHLRTRSMSLGLSDESSRESALGGGFGIAEH